MSDSVRRYSPVHIDDYEVSAEQYEHFWQFSVRFRGLRTSTTRTVRVDRVGNIVTVDQFSRALEDEERRAINSAFKRLMQS